MSLSRDSRQEKKLKAFRRAQFRLKQRFEYIDWEEDFLIPEVDALKAGSEVLGLEAGCAFDIRVERDGEVQEDYSDEVAEDAIGTTEDDNQNTSGGCEAEAEVKIDNHNGSCEAASDRQGGYSD